MDGGALVGEDLPRLVLDEHLQDGGEGGGEGGGENEVKMW